MKTEYRYLLFVEQETKTKTKIFRVTNKVYSDCLLGYVKWYAPWRKYCFFTPDNGLVFDVGCLIDIQDFINNLMAEHKEKKGK